MVVITSFMLPYALWANKFYFLAECSSFFAVLGLDMQGV